MLSVLYRVYGLSVALPPGIDGGLERTRNPATIRVTPWGQKLQGMQDWVSWYHHRQTPEGDRWLSAGHRQDGWYVLRFEGVDFAVSANAEEIQYRLRTGSGASHVRHLLLNLVIPMVMNLRGTEVLHASTVWTPRGAIAFVGDAGFGKSTLAASLLQEGFEVIADDAVPLLLHGRQIWTQSGPPEIGLWPPALRLLIKSNGEIDDMSEKFRVRLTGAQHRAGDFSLARFYFLKPSDRTTSVKVVPMAAREILIELTRAAHRLDLTDRNMLRRQFATLHQVARLVPAKALTYPAGIPDPSKLRSAVLRDIHCNSS